MNNKNTVPMKPALLRIEQLRPFEGHPYKVQDNEEMAALSESIRENGVLSVPLKTAMNMKSSADTAACMLPGRQV